MPEQSAQEQHLSRELELMLERLESPGWDLAPHAGQPSAVPAAAVARVPAAYQPKVLSACCRATVHVTHASQHDTNDTNVDIEGHSLS